MIKKFVLAPDSFKESMTANEVCQAMSKGILTVFPNAEIVNAPMADGGEGTTDVLIEATKGEKIEAVVTGPLANQKVKTYFGFLGNSKTAVIEMAKASGLELLSEAERNPLLTTTFGTGELIKAALDYGAEKIVLGIGGSATNDGGAGMAQTLGARLLDGNGNSIALGAAALSELRKIDVTNLDRRVQKIEFLVASDVTNPLCGKNGASYVFGGQKGASPEMMEQLDKNLQHYARLISRDLGIDVENVKGGGAAGGLGAGLLAFTPAKLQSGIRLVCDLIELDEKIKRADFVFTGEGGMDFQTKFGKVPYGVAQIAQKYDVPCLALAGHVGKDVDVLYDEGITAIFGIQSKACDLETALREGKSNVERTTANIARLLALQNE